MISSFHRPTVASVNLDNIIYNLHQVMAHLPEGKQAWAVVKANAYGHGAVEVAKSLAKHVSGFCISNLDEALELREAGIDSPLLVLGVTPVQALDLALQEDIQLTLSSQEWLDAALQQKGNLSGLSFHVKVDSGMGRLGFRDSQTLNHAVEHLCAQGAEFAGVFTHFATADEADSQHFDQQLHFFKDLIRALPKQPNCIHASNSAASLWHKEATFSAVRLGDVLYGLNPSGINLELPYNLKPALELTSELVQVKELSAGQPIGYGATYHTRDREWIATLPVGYADGLTRDMQGFHVLVDGELCPIVGRVSMDQICIKLPHPYPIGSPVTLIGRMGEREITAQDWADYRSTINYEIVCLLSDRIPRRYK